MNLDSFFFLASAIWNNTPFANCPYLPMRPKYSFFFGTMGRAWYVWGWRCKSSLFRPYPWTMVDFVCPRLSPCTQQQQWRGRKEMFGDLSFFFSLLACLALIHPSHPIPSYPITTMDVCFCSTEPAATPSPLCMCVCVCCVVLRIVCTVVACLMLCFV